MTIAERIARFIASVASLAALCLGVPWLLVLAARSRFDGPTPWAGVPAPSAWDLDEIRSTLTGRITESLIADVVLRAALMTAWVTLVVLVLTVSAEVVHQLRHGGLGLPNVRGLGWGQPAARHLAAGLLILTSMASAAKVGAGSPLPMRAALPGVVVAAAGPSAPEDIAAMVDPPVLGRTPLPTSYTVQPGDSVYGIAERLAAGEATAVARLADAILDLNLGRTMPGGVRFVNAAYIEPGWVLELPGADPASPAAPPERQHLVRAGDSLWSIAADRLGEPTRWQEIWTANAGRTMDDGRRFDDPSTIHPGWLLDLPGPEVGHLGAATPEEAVSVTDTADAGQTALAPEALSEVVHPEALSEVVHPEALPEVARPEALPEVARPEALPEVVQPEAASVPPGSDTVEPAAEMEPVVEPRWAEVDPDLERPAPEEPMVEGLGTVAPLVGLGRAAAVSAGILAVVAALRARHLRSARPGARRPAVTPTAARVERRLRVAGIGDPVVRLDLAVRCLAAAVVDRDLQFTVCTSAADGTVEFHLTGNADLPLPWVGAGRYWSLPGRTPIDELAAVARTVDAPAPTLVQLGVDPGGRGVFADLEALGTLTIEASDPTAEAVVAAIGVALAGSPFAEAVRIVAVGLEPDCLLHHPNGATADTIAMALDEMELTADVPPGTTTFALRARGRGGETWDPTVVLAGPSRADAEAPVGVVPARGGALVVTGPAIEGAAALRADVDRWTLTGAAIDQPIELVPIGLDLDDRADLAELLRQADEPVPVPEVLSDPRVEFAPAAGSNGAADHPGPSDPAPAEPASVDDEWALMVRLLGPVEIVDRSGVPARFEKSKNLELVAWLVTHRERSTRAGARTALWEADVRDATFSNVVSAARRGLGQLASPPSDQQWIGRSQGDRLPLHPSIVLDADVVEQRLDAARRLPDAAAVEMLESAVELVRGLPFEGTSYLWPDGEGITSRLVLIALEVTAELARRHLALGDLGGVLRATERGLRVVPGHEALVALRLQAHAGAGDHAGLRREWEAYLRVVVSDPWGDGEPATELVTLRDELLSARVVAGS